ncbi:MAG TPA: GNAT family N-acetyltransferase [Blastocatellia bacterium]|nr:GNAT family N-acetyltransferase [Blastocatellia bacterium]
MVEKTNDYKFVTPVDAEAWQAYHEIRRKVLFEDRGLFGVYDQNHPDELADGNFPKLLLYRSEPVGVVRIDIAGSTATLRRVAIRADAQGCGHGRALLSFAEDFAGENGCSEVRSHSAVDAVGFYEKCGYTAAFDELARQSATISRLMTKRL